MEKLVPFGRVLFGTGLLGLGVQHFRLGEFVVGRPPAWPEALPGGVAWAALTGGLFIGVGVATLAGRHARPALLAAGSLVLVWCLLRHVPIVAQSSFPSAAWTNAGKALRFVGGALAIAAVMPTVGGDRRGSLWRILNLRRVFVMIAQVAVGLTLILNGIQHFVFTEFVAGLIPDWFPGDAVFWTWFGGVALIAGGLGMLVPKTAPLASLMSGVMVFSWFWIIHLPRTFFTTSDGIAVFEVLVTAGSLFVIAGFYTNQRRALKGDAYGSAEPRDRTSLPLNA